MKKNFGIDYVAEREKEEDGSVCMEYKLNFALLKLFYDFLIAHTEFFLLSTSTFLLCDSSAHGTESEL